LGLLLASEREEDRALEAYAVAIEAQRELVEQHPDSAAHKRSLAESYSNVGLLQGQHGAKDVARESLLSSIEILKQLHANTPNDPQLRHDLAIGYNNLSFVEREVNWADSEATCREAIDLLEALVAEEESAAYRSDLALCYNNFGAILAHRDQWEEACESYEKAIDLQRQLTRQAGAVVVYRRDLAVSLNQLGQAQQQLGELPAALQSFGEAEEIVAQLADDYPNELTMRSLCGAVLNNRAMALEASHQNDVALPVYEEAIAHQRVAFSRAPSVTEYREFLSKHYFNYGRALRAAGRPKDAAAAALKRRELWPEHGDHLGQIAVELAQAAAQLRGETDDSSQVAALEAEALATLRNAAAHGGNLAELRKAAALSFLQEDVVWGKVNAAAATAVQ
jgi:tetratricopeptide (TPR) repeat protein